MKFSVISERTRLWATARSTLHPIEMVTGAIHGYIECRFNSAGLDLAADTRAEIEVEARSLKSGNFLLDRELARRLEIKRYPQVSAIADRVEKASAADRYLVGGRLSIHGVTRSVKGEVTVRRPDPETIEIEGGLALDMRDFGLEPPRLLILRVYPEVLVRMRLVARAET